MRKLAIFLFSFSAVIFAANYLLPLTSLLWLAAALSLLGLLVLLRKQEWLLAFALLFLGGAFGCLRYYIHAQTTLEPALKLDGQSLEIEGRITDYPQIYDNSSRVELVLTG